MKTKVVIEIETSKMKQFVPEEGMSPKDCTKKEIKDATDFVEENLQGAIKQQLKKHIEEYAIDGLEEDVIESGDELPECESFNDFGKVKIKVI